MSRPQRLEYTGLSHVDKRGKITADSDRIILAGLSSSGNEREFELTPEGFIQLYKDATQVMISLATSDRTAP